jgi:hypothetical protein
MTDKNRQFYSFLPFFHEYFIFLESFLRTSVKTHALFWHPYCWDTHDVLIVPADAVIPDINGALGVGLTVCCYWLQHFCKVPVFAGVPTVMAVLWLLSLPIEYRTGKFEKLADYWISDQSFKLSDYQISYSQKNSCPSQLK